MIKPLDNTSIRSSATFSELVGDRLTDAVIQTDEQGTILNCNREALAMLGYAESDLIGSNSSHLFPAGLPQVFCLSEAASGCYLLGDRPAHTVCEMRHSNGQPLLVKVINTQLRNAGANGHLLILIRDNARITTDSKRGRTKTSQVGMYILRSGSFRFANRQFQQYLGFGEKELLGINPISRIHPNDRYRVRQEAIAMLKNNRFEGYEFRFINRDGEIRWACESVMRITCQGKAGILGSFVDITEAKETAG